MRMALRWEIARMSLAVKGHVNVWKGRTVGAEGTVRLGGRRGRGYDDLTSRLAM